MKKICVVRNSELSITTSFYRVIDAIFESDNIPLIISRKRESDKLYIDNKRFKFKDNNIDNFEINLNAKRGNGFRNIFQLFVYQIILIYLLIKNRKKYDVIHAFDLDSGLVSFILCRFYGKKFLYHIADFYSDSIPMPKFIKNLVNRIELFVINNSDEVIICTEERLEQIKGHTKKNINIVYNSPIVKRHNIWIEQKIDISTPLRLCYIGSLSKNRLIPEIVDLVKNIDNIFLDIGGVGDCQEYVSYIASNSDNINFHGKVEYHKAVEIYNKCDLMFAIYNPNIENNRYSAPNKVYEAMLLGKPIIVANNTSVDKLVTKHDMGFVIDYNKESFKELLEYILKNRNELIEKSKHAFNSYEHYSWDKMKYILVDIYSKL